MYLLCKNSPLAISEKELQRGESGNGCFKGRPGAKAEYSALLRAQLLKFISTFPTECLERVNICLGSATLSVFATFPTRFSPPHDSPAAEEPGSDARLIYHSLRAGELCVLSRCTVAEVPLRQQKPGA